MEDSKLQAKLVSIFELNDKLREQLEIQRITVSDASKSLIEYCQNTSDSLVPSLWNSKRKDFYSEPAGDCGCISM
ncbi:hypothetical protein BDF14DRAFT_1828178 [Spinellus fusiger]|nr:hypothetical protein BDF14DRAFT_1828178 [Spinellus fusiger]